MIAVDYKLCLALFFLTMVMKAEIGLLISFSKCLFSKKFFFIMVLFAQNENEIVDNAKIIQRVIKLLNHFDLSLNTITIC